MALEEVGLGLVMQFKTQGTEVFSAVSAALTKLRGDMSSVEGAASKMGPQLQSAGVVAAAGLGAAVVAAGAIGAAAVKMAGDFQNASVHLVTDAGESAANLGMVQSGILSLSRTVGVSATDLTNAMYLVESAGYHGAAGLSVLKAAEEGARVGGADAATMADAVTSALNAYALPATQATAVTNDLIAAVAQGKTHLQDIAGALGMVLPSAAALHIPLEQVTGALATMTAQGTPAADAATYLRYTLASLANPTSKAKTELAAVGLSSERLTTVLTTQGLPSALQLLTDAIGRKFPEGSSAYLAALSNIVGGTRGMQASLELTGPHLQTYIGNVHAVTSAVAEGGNQIKDWGAIQATANFQFDRAKATISSLVIQLGMRLLPAVTSIVAGFNDHLLPALAGVAAFTEKYRGILGPLALGFGVVTVALAAYATAIGVAAVASVAFEAATSPISGTVVAVSLAVAGVIVVGKLLVDHWNQITATARRLWEGFNSLPAPLKILTALIVGPVVDGVVLLATHWSQVTGAIRTAWEALSAAAPGIWGAITSTVHGAVNGIIDGINALIRALDAIQIHIPSVDVGPIHTPGFNWGGMGIPQIPHLATGGIVTSPTIALIGEGGPEAVVPLGRGGAATRLEVTVNVTGMPTREVAREVSKLITSELHNQIRMPA